PPHIEEIPMALTIQGVCIPDSQLVRAPTESVRDTVLPLIVDHSSRVYYFRAQTGAHRGWSFHRALLHAGALFHDLGLTQSAAASKTASKWRARTQPAISCAGTASLKRMPIRFGRRSRCTRRPASHDTCIL